MAITIGAIVVIVLIFLMNAIRVVREYERGVIFRLGRLVGAKGPGIFLLIPIVDKMVKITLRLVTLDRKSTRLNSSHIPLSRMPSSA